ncbi:hypothetical protein CPB83DRAFT_860894 [Crepidotus variabilis]|uniref:Signal recognition particle subunit SRP68 n=1 Tax=Crepidotus variabilis TaxID=179855 RepID=A0A9P6E8J2_9AGAR|nr:hypothetical protein CPB83DRAFT_860894 [Crepidotus variabilis]
MTEIVRFRALQLANEQRNAYGLRYNDFQRYRKHCANRTHRLRSTLKMTHGKGREFKKLPLLNPEIVKDGHLQLLLFEAERAWAHAQELNAEALKPASKEGAGTLRHSATGRFRRAVNWATQLLSLCQTLHSSSRLSAESLLEITIYTVILNGRFLRYRDEFEDAVIRLSVARGLLDELANAASTSRDQALAIQFSDEIGPEIRYCAHELGHPKAYDVQGIAADLYPKHRNQIVNHVDNLISKLSSEGGSSNLKAKLKERIWEGEPVPVRYPELVDVLLKVEAAETALGTSGTKKSKSGVTAYDAVLSSLSDAEEVARKLQESQQPIGNRANSTANKGRDISFVHSYLVYELLSRRIQRDLLLMSTLLASGGVDKSKVAISKLASSSKSNPETDSRLYPAIVKLLDAVIQSFTQMRTLSVVDDHPTLPSAVDARLTFTNTKRCIYLAHCYSSVKKYAEALALLQHATIHLRETSSSLEDSEPDLAHASTSFFALTHEDIKEVENTITGDGFQYKREWFTHNGGSVDGNPSTHKKPLFFNIALNYVELDMDRLQARAGKQPPLVAAPSSTPSKGKTESSTVEKKPIPKSKVEEQVPDVAPSSPPQQSRGGLSNLLGGWWR